MQQMVAADGRRVAVAGNHNHVQLRPNDLDRLGHRQRPAVERVDRLEVHVGAHAARAADAGDQDRVVLIQAEVVHYGRQLRHDQTDAAARAPDRGEEIGLQLVLDCHNVNLCGDAGQPTRAGTGEPDGAKPAGSMSMRSCPSAMASMLIRPPSSATRSTRRRSIRSTTLAYCPSLPSMTMIFL